jgi:cell division protein FtsQ
MVERVPPFRSRVGKKRSPSPWMYIFIFLFFTGMLLILFLRSPLSKIERIEVIGNRLVPTGEILAKTKVAKGISYFGVNASHAEAVLEAMPEIETAKVEKMFPNRIYIQIQEKPPVAILMISEQKFLPILSNGTILENRPVVSQQFQPTFEGWARSSSTMKLAAVQLDKLPKNILSEIKVIRPVPGKQDQIEIWSGRNHRIFIRAKDLSKKMLYYPSFIHHPRGTLFLLESIWFIPDKEMKVKPH